MSGCSSLGCRVRVDLIGQGCELEISRIMLIGNLRVVDISGFDVILDMDELTAIGLSVIVTLGRSSLTYPMVFESCRVAYACGVMRMCMEFRDEILLRGGACETPRKS